MTTLLIIGNRVVNLAYVKEAFLSTENGQLKLLLDGKSDRSVDMEIFEGDEAEALRWWMRHNIVDVVAAQAEADREAQQYELARDQIDEVKQHEADEFVRLEMEEFAGGTAP